MTIQTTRWYQNQRWADLERMQVEQYAKRALWEQQRSSWEQQRLLWKQQVVEWRLKNTKED